ncbi:MAG: farnesyl-diphosphate farnesyltransferase [Verrucomicrobiota bacterium]|jgi:farnesyl-diphosphate farnesyltransferase
MKRSASAEQLLGPVLRSVSRSFYISIRLLPMRVREPVGLAYLLARATDTLADTFEVPASVRKEALQTVAAAIQSDDAVGGTLDLQKTFVPLQSNEAERTLIGLLPECLRALAQISSADRDDIRVVLAKITRAQAMDLEWFGDAGQAKAPSTAADLHLYTYLIAGCVGEFWTQICSRHVGNFSKSAQDQMLPLGKRYGQGLQLINILRDAGDDLRGGRCYFPAEELHAHSLEPSEILEKPTQFLPVYARWLEEAERGLKAGMQYVEAVENRRIRGATALPALIGARTLALLHEAGAAVFERRIKVPRRETKRMIGSVAMSLASKRSLDRMFQRLSR